MKIDNNLELQYFYKEKDPYYCLIYNKDNISKTVIFYLDGFLGYNDLNIIFKDYKDQSNIIIEYINQQVKQLNIKWSMVSYEKITKLFSDLINNKKKRLINENRQ